MSQTILTEKELEAVFYNKKDRKKNKIRGPISGVGFFLVLCLLFYLALNAKSLYLRTSFWYSSTYKNSTEQDQSLANLFANKNPDLTKTKDQIPRIDNDSISISTINVSAPIVWNVQNTSSDVTSGLQKGTIHLAGTALPGQIGNVFITGHSSNYPWAKGKYNSIFALLGKLVTGDLIRVRYHDQDYIYKVSGSKVVKPDDLTSLKQGNQSILSVMTCTPVGTSINRLIVTAKQVYPDPKLNSLRPADSNTINDLPGAR